MHVQKNKQYLNMVVIKKTQIRKNIIVNLK